MSESLNSQAQVESSIQEPIETFKDYLSAKGFRITNQRIAIFEAAYHHPEHYTAEDLLDSARKIDHSVSRATVYRALPLLVESGLIREVDIGRDFKYYMANKDVKTFQAQVICAESDTIYEVDAPFMEWYGKAVANKLGMDPVSQRLQVIARPKKEDAQAAPPKAGAGKRKTV